MASSAQAKQFIETIAPIIQEEAKARGYKVCSAIIAQACIESGYNTSLLSMRYHNYHGLKCGSAWKGPSVNMATKEEYTPGQLTSIRDNFRTYPDMISGVKGYFDFISTSRYANLKGAATAQEYLELIKKDGYATSSSYVSSCMAVISRHDLERYDSETTPKGNPYALTTTLMKRGSTGESVRWLQYCLCEKGFDLKNDGLYGPKTEEAVKAFQQKVFCDGICGPLTISKLNK